MPLSLALLILHHLQEVKASSQKKIKRPLLFSKPQFLGDSKVRPNAAETKDTILLLEETNIFESTLIVRDCASPLQRIVIMREPINFL